MSCARGGCALALLQSVMMPLGRVAVLAMGRGLGAAAVWYVVVQAIGWSLVWSPRTPAQWERVPGPTAATLAAVQARIPGSAAVFVSQGVVGRFSGRLDVRPVSGDLPVRPGQDWFVFAPWAGIETESTAEMEVNAASLVRLDSWSTKTGMNVAESTPPSTMS